MISLEMTGDNYDGIPAEASALTVDDLKDLAIKKEPLYIPHCIAMIKGQAANIATLTSEKAALAEQVETLTGQVESLTAQVEALTPADDTEETEPGGEGGGE